MTNTGMPGGSGGRSAPDRARRAQLMADAAGFPPVTALPVARPRLHLALVTDLQEADAADFLPATALPEWMPRQVRAAALPAGVWWDAVTATGPLARRVMLALGGGTGAVIEDRREDVLHWLVRPGAADGWSVPPGVTVRGPGYALTVPALHRTRGPGLFWQVPPIRDGHLTDPAALLAALRSAWGETR